MAALEILKKEWKFFFILLWPTLLSPLLIIGNSQTTSCGFTVALMAGYWVTEALPIPVTSLLPLVLYPILGIQSTDVLTRQYMKDSIFAYIGGLIIALAIEFCGLHKRVALRVILWTGTSVNMLMLGIMICTAVLSMWMSNTAVSAMMVPIIMAVLAELQHSLINILDRMKLGQYEGEERIQLPKLKQRITPATPLEDEHGSDCGMKQDSDHQHQTVTIPGSSIKRNETGEQDSAVTPTSDEEMEHFLRNIRTMFLLSCCYASNIGGTGVITGCGTNLVAMEYLGNLDPAHHGDYAALTFTTWMAFNIVPMTINIALAWVYLQVIFLGLPDWVQCVRKTSKEKTPSKSQINVHKMLQDPSIQRNVNKVLLKNYKELGAVTIHEKGVTFCFLLAIMLWIFHDPRFIPGWSSLFSKKIKVSTASLAVSSLFFAIPRNEDFYSALWKRDFRGVKFQPLLEWPFIQAKLPWGVLILLGGGYAMSNGAQKSGLSEWIGHSLLTFANLPPWLFLALICVMIAFLTEIASNSATATVLLPILLELSKELKPAVHPLYFTLPATVVCSYAFMLPAATPPNAIVYAATDMKVKDMVKAGFFMNCSTVFILYCCTVTYGNAIFHFSDYVYKP